MRPEAENVLLEIGEQEFMMWTHNPITAAYLQFMDDQLVLWRENAADLVENGAFRNPDQRHEDSNPDVVRGKLLAMRQLRGITLADIQSFYGKEPPEESQEDLGT